MNVTHKMHQFETWRIARVFLTEIELDRQVLQKRGNLGNLLQLLADNPRRAGYGTESNWAVEPSGALWHS
jgi:hypothetical protein